VQRELALRAVVSRDVLCAGVPHLQRAHWLGVAEERAAGGRCGYPLCANALPSDPLARPQYSIDRRRKQVHDATELRSYCSRDCLSASIHVRNQISELPLAVRVPSSFRTARLTFLEHAPREQQKRVGSGSGGGGGVNEGATRHAAGASSRSPIRATAAEREARGRENGGAGNVVIVTGASGNDSVDDNAAAAAATATDHIAVKERVPTANPVPPTPNTSRPNAHLLIEGYEPGTARAGDSGEGPGVSAGVHIPMAPPSRLRSPTNASSEPDPWDGFEQGLEEMRRQEQETERKKLLASAPASRAAEARLELALPPDADGADTAGVRSAMADGGGNGHGSASADGALTAGSGVNTHGPAVIQPFKVSFGDLRKTLASWRTQGTADLLLRKRTATDVCAEHGGEAVVVSDRETRSSSSSTAPGYSDVSRGETEPTERRLPPVDSRSQRRVRLKVFAEQIDASVTTVLGCAYAQIPRKLFTRRRTAPKLPFV
jgi:hypothetical protein